MVRLFRKVFLIDFLFSLFKNKEPHLKFAGFLTVFSFFWFGIMALTILATISKIQENPAAVVGGNISVILICLGFFLLYRKVSLILKKSDLVEAAHYRFLRFINPIAPIIYFTTAFLIALGIINMIMFFLMVIGFLIYVLGIAFTLGMALASDSYKLSEFTGVPTAFFEMEKYVGSFLNPNFIPLFILFIYFFIPLMVCFIIVGQHYSMKKLSVKNEGVQTDS